MSSQKLCIAFVVFALVSKSVIAADAFYYTSSKSAWVGSGQTELLTPSSGAAFGVYRYFNQGAYTNDIQITAGPWELNFVGPSGTLAVVGAYLNAIRYPFNGNQPGLDFSGNGRGDNMLTGQFQVLDAVFDTAGNVLQYAADFTQYDEGVATRWNVGSIRYHSDIPVNTVPEPTTLALLTLGGVIVFVVKRHAA